MIRYVCRRCGSDRIQGTRPAWFEVNTFTPGIGSLGTAYNGEAEWGHGWCERCDASGPFSDVALAFVLNPDVPSDMAQMVFPDRIESFRFEDGSVVEHHVTKRPDAAE